MSEEDISGHYARRGLLETIVERLAELGKGPGTVTVEDLGPVDEFHMGGREASDALLGQLGFAPGQHLVDLGCGVGGAARLVASRYGARVTGVDLTADYVETGTTLCEWVGLDDLVTLRRGSVLDLPFDDATFDGGYLLHVGMNIEAKPALFAEASRVLLPGAVFGVYDVMRVGDGEITYPMPWAETPAASHVADPAEYRSALESAGFVVGAERDRREFALDFFARLRATSEAAGGPPPVGLHLLMGASAGVKVAHMVEDLAAGRIAPVEMVARKVA